MKKTLVTLALLALSLSMQIRHQSYYEHVECVREQGTDRYNCDKGYGHIIRGDGYFNRHISDDVELENCNQTEPAKISCTYKETETGTINGNINDGGEM